MYIYILSGDAVLFAIKLRIVLCTEISNVPCSAGFYVFLSSLGPYLYIYIYTLR